jgi:hypothetical protein
MSHSIWSFLISHVRDHAWLENNAHVVAPSCGLFLTCVEKNNSWDTFWRIQQNHGQLKWPTLYTLFYNVENGQVVCDCYFPGYTHIEAQLTYINFLLHFVLQIRSGLICFVHMTVVTKLSHVTGWHRHEQGLSQTHASAQLFHQYYPFKAMSRITPLVLPSCGDMTPPCAWCTQDGRSWVTTHVHTHLLAQGWWGTRWRQNHSRTGLIRIQFVMERALQHRLILTHSWSEDR